MLLNVRWNRRIRKLIFTGKFNCSMAEDNANNSESRKEDGNNPRHRFGRAHHASSQSTDQNRYVTINQQEETSTQQEETPTEALDGPNEEAQDKAQQGIHSQPETPDTQALTEQVPSDTQEQTQLLTKRLSDRETEQLAEQPPSADQELPTEESDSEQSKRKRRPNPIARLVNRWFDRVMGAVREGGFSGQEEEYAAHRTTRDFIWNTIGAGSWGLVLPIVSMVATQLVGAEQAGMVTMAFTIGLLLMFVGNFGVRTYQVSDIDETYSFNDYQISRWFTCVVMILVGMIYCWIRGYGAEMFTICMGIFVYRMVDGLADVYEGRLQQMDKMYLAGISQAFRSIFSLVVFCIALLISFNAAVASVAMAIAAGVTFIIVTYPLSLLETPRSRKASLKSVLKLIQSTFPLFLAIFLFNLIDAMPRFVMESMLPYDNQLYYYALYFPAQGILMTVQLVYKPLLVRMAGVWHDSAKRRRFDLILVGILLVVIAITVVTEIIMMWIGLPILSFLYGLDFEEFRGLLAIMIAAGGVVAAVDFLYQVITVMRRQRDVTALYLVTFGFSIFVPILLIGFTGLPGAMLSYLIVESILFVLLVWEYLRIRNNLAHQGDVPENNGSPGSKQYHTEVQDTDQSGLPTQSEQEEAQKREDATEQEEKLRPSEIRARRLRREEVMNRRVKNRKN